jgi:lipid II:glycine glycyltransferase (peptidoglycan interpeptide bridge formation enzyme)
MVIKEISDSDSAEYNRLAREYGTVFNTIDWLKIFGETVKIYGIYDKGSNLIGGFSVYKEKKLGLSIYRNPPFTPAAGPFLRIHAKNPVSIISTWKKVLFLIADFLEDLPYSVLSICINKSVVDTQPFIWKKFKVIPGYTYVLDLSRSIEDIWNDMSGERRNNMSKAIRDKLIAKQSSDFEIIKSLVLKTFSKQEATVNECYLDKVLFEFAHDDNSFAFVTFKNDKPIATSFCVYDAETAYALLGGYDYENKHKGGAALALWESMKYAEELGLKYFDFEGSMIPRFERYFRGFGGKLTPYYKVNKAKLPLEMLLKFFKRELF